MAAKFWRAGQHPRLGAGADVEVSFDGNEYLIECKRPFSATRVEGLIEEARNQLRSRLSRGQGGARGLIALSYSKLREEPSFADAADEYQAQAALVVQLRTELERIAPTWTPIDENVVAGVMLHLIKPMKLNGPKLYVTAQELLVVARQGSQFSADLRHRSGSVRDGSRTGHVEEILISTSR